MRKVFKIAIISCCLGSLYQGDALAAEDSIIKQQKEGGVRHGRQENWQRYSQPILTEEAPKKAFKQETKREVLKTEEKKSFALGFLDKKIEKSFDAIMDDKKSPQYKKLTRLMEDIMAQPWELSGEGQPERLKGQYKGHEGCYSRRIDHCNRLVYTVNAGSVKILACEGHYK